MRPEDSTTLRLRLIDQLIHLPAAQLDAVERLLTSLPTKQGAAETEAPPESRASVPSLRGDWPHAPLHRISEEGTYIVTAATLDKAHVFRGPERLDYLQNALLRQVRQAGWALEAWAVFSNHYHFVAHAQQGSALLSDLLRELHRVTSLHVNELDHSPGRQTRFQFWETRLTYESSYLARLSYVHQNPVKHGLVCVANQYRWCSSAWFEQSATEAQVKTLARMKIDRVRVEDDFDPV
jgi:putative transposase